uniref:Uncharacterized protein n=1 Tax=Aegilops tauschii subsp. strangulata TaxID=200361 RepID=A0A453S398_AEGTS
MDGRKTLYTLKYRIERGTEPAISIPNLDFSSAPPPACLLPTEFAVNLATYA